MDSLPYNKTFPLSVVLRKEQCVDLNPLLWLHISVDVFSTDHWKSLVSCLHMRNAVTQLGENFSLVILL